MDQLNYDDTTFTELNYAGKTVKGREFQSCTFKRCDFSEADLSHNKFLECTFEHCNLSMAKLNGSTLSDVRFDHCKLLAVNFFECQDFLFSVGFDGCMMDYSSFMRKKMLKTKFQKCSLKEANFTQTNLGGSVFDGSDLFGVIFNGTDLSSCNFVQAFNYIIDPELNHLRKASFSLQGLSGLLDKYGIKIV